MASPAEPPFTSRRASGAKVRECGRSEVRPRYGEELAYRGISMEYARLVWRCYLANGTNMNEFPTFEKQDVLTKPAGLVESAAMAYGGVRAGRPPSSSALPDDEENRKIMDVVEADAGVQVRDKRCLRNLQELRRAKNRKMAESVSEAVVQAVKLVYETVVIKSLGVVVVAAQRNDKMTGQIAVAMPKVVSLKATSSD